MTIIEGVTGNNPLFQPTKKGRDPHKVERKPDQFSAQEVLRDTVIKKRSFIIDDKEEVFYEVHAKITSRDGQTRETHFTVHNASLSQVCKTVIVMRLAARKFSYVQLNHWLSQPMRLQNIDSKLGLLVYNGKKRCWNALTTETRTATGISFRPLNSKHLYYWTVNTQAEVWGIDGYNEKANLRPSIFERKGRTWSEWRGDVYANLLRGFGRKIHQMSKGSFDSFLPESLKSASFTFDDQVKRMTTLFSHLHKEDEKNQLLDQTLRMWKKEGHLGDVEDVASFSKSYAGSYLTYLSKGEKALQLKGTIASLKERIFPKKRVDLEKKNRELIAELEQELTQTVTDQKQAYAQSVLLQTEEAAKTLPGSDSKAKQLVIGEAPGVRLTYILKECAQQLKSAMGDPKKRDFLARKIDLIYQATDFAFEDPITGSELINQAFEAESEQELAKVEKEVEMATPQFLKSLKCDAQCLLAQHTK